MKLSVSLSWRDEMNFYRERSIIRLDVSWIYIFIQKDDIAFDKVESLSFVFSLKRKRIVFIAFDNLCFSILLFSFRK